jgi:tetratricopeptide (TPR) repeat protein/tRNA A-37 threonylcarbamoyl transferase component Bud32
MACLDDNVIAAYFDFRLTADDTRRMFDHVDVCEPCARLVFATASARATQPTETGADVGAPVRPTSLGRYRIDRILGMGGMGVVYAGYDPQLDRAIAIKLLRPHARVDAAALHARLVREAQAMAKLSHPNVIGVHEVSTLDDQVFVVMELIDGSTLGEWARAPRSWREIVAAFRAAGEGLAAAHAAGIVHRDFKPDNVLVATTGRICVTDFGLATRIEAAAEPAWQSIVVGTPLYMAPEQIRGELVDARSDMFSFCVALYEALCGTKPFAGATLDELCGAIEAGRIAPPTRPAPRWLVRAVEAGLRARPADRPASMTELLAALAADPAPRRRRWLVAGVATVAVVGGVVAWRTAASAPEPCLGADRELAGVWDIPRRIQLAGVFAAAGKGYLADSSGIVARMLDERGAAWTAQRTDACEATRVRGEQSEALLDRRVRCLDDRLRETGALVDVLLDGGPALDRAATAAAGLEPLDVCRDPVEGPAPPRDRAKLDATTALVALADAQRATGKYKEATATAQHALADARTLAYKPTLAAALFVSGQLAVRAAKFDDANALLGDAAVAAQEAHDDRLAARIYLRLAYLAGEQERPREQGQWAQLADGAIRRLGGDPRLEMQRLRVQADREHQAKQLAAAEADYRKALAIAEKDRSASGLEDRAIARANLGNVLRDEKRYHEAVATLREALDEIRRALGADHPVTGQTLEALAVATGLELGGQSVRAANEAMLPMFRDQLALFRRAYGDSHPRVANTLYNIGDVLSHLGRDDEAIPVLEQSVAMFRQFADDKSTAVNGPRAALGEAYVRAHRYADAVAALEPALGVDTGDEPAKKLALAEALWQTGGDRARAVALATDAQRDPELAADAGAWLKRHARP